MLPKNQFFTHQLFLILRKTRRADFRAWILANPDRAAKLGLEDVFDMERVKITTVPPPNEGSAWPAVGVSMWITQAQRDYWVLVKDKVPPEWANDIDGTIRRVSAGGVDVSGWLAAQDPPLYILDTPES